MKLDPEKLAKAAEEKDQAPNVTEMASPPPPRPDPFLAAQMPAPPKLDPVEAASTSEKSAQAWDDDLVIYPDTDGTINNTSTAKYIYAIIDKVDRRILMMLALPHIRKHVARKGKLLAEKVWQLADVEADCIEDVQARIIRLCLIGAILTQGGEWIAHPKVSSLTTQKAS